MIKAVVFDLDDTLLPEIEYVKSGFRAISEAKGDVKLYEKLITLFEENRKDVYQRAGFFEEECRECMEIYRNHFPDISLSEETENTLITLKNNGVKLGIITDGRPTVQRNKIKALGLDEIIDCIIVTDELGGEEFRKPHPKSFELMREKLGVEFHEMMYVGDNPRKDFYIGSIYPIKTVRLAGHGIYDRCEYFKGRKEDRCILNINDVCALSEEF